MNTNLIKLRVLPALAVLCIHSAALATQPTAAGGGSAAAQVASGGSMSIGSNGSALSYASSSQSAHAATTAATAHTPNYSNVRASIAGETGTQSAGVAYNTSTGAGTGWAQAAGQVSAGAGGTVGIHGVSLGDSGGDTRTQSNLVINAARDQGSSVQGCTASGFETGLRFDRSQGVTVNATTTGYVTGTNATNTLAGLNAAGLASIQASGYFSGVGQVGGSTGTLPRP